ncbi:ABC transporter permease [Candidatus Acetothermia bacterium]|jgi:ABC-2 type transport system permease protein|nr:ABC transporter permease [Candidatus Acetothermia bacterium]MCI2432695.1 ABC transporter permease [Candidatus Acetothermia bacterium]MCI2436083.1 ABC transporter permease [Candidatus Acetothermia bacterium]
MIGFLTLLKREIVRFLKDALDTIVPPTVGVILFMLIFGLALGARLGEVDGVPYIQFVMPGLILISVIRNSFMNPAYSLFQSRWEGNIADFLVSPLSHTQIALAIILGGVLRGLIVGALVLCAALFLTDLPFAQPVLLFIYALAVSVGFAGLGCIVGLWTKGWEGVNTVNTFVLDPLVMLGGVFYSLEMVRGVPIIEPLTALNPLTYITEGFRQTVLGGSEAQMLTGLGLTLALGAICVGAALVLFRVGYHLKA